MSDPRTLNGGLTANEKRSRPWDEFLSERDRAVFAAAGYGRKAALGTAPALLVVDMTNGFCGDRPEPILESITRYRTSCGAEAWVAIDYVKQLAAAAREGSVPIIATRGTVAASRGLGHGWSAKNSRASDDRPDAHELVAPLDGIAERVIEKEKPSAFFGTPLLTRLVEQRIDTLVVCGASTSGCVRSTVVDAFSRGYKVAVAEEATCDRGEASHALSLFDMSMKYADVMPVAELCAYLSERRTTP